MRYAVDYEQRNECRRLKTPGIIKGELSDKNNEPTKNSVGPVADIDSCSLSCSRLLDYLAHGSREKYERQDEQQSKSSHFMQKFFHNHMKSNPEQHHKHSRHCHSRYHAGKQRMDVDPKCIIFQQGAPDHQILQSKPSQCLQVNVMLGVVFRIPHQTLLEIKNYLIC